MSGSGLLPCKLTSNQQLEQRFADQSGKSSAWADDGVFLPPRVADLIVASGTEKQKAIAGDYGALLRFARASPGSRKAPTRNLLSC